MESDPSTWFVSQKIKVIAWNALSTTTASHSAGLIAAGTWEHPQRNSTLLWRMNILNHDYLRGLQEEFRDYETNLQSKIAKLHDPFLLATHPIKTGGFVSDLQWIPFSPEQFIISTSKGNLEHISSNNLEHALGLDMFEDSSAIEQVNVDLKTEYIWNGVHNGCITSVDIQKDLQLITSVGEDGCLNLLALEEKTPVFSFKNADSMAINNVKFIGSQQILTASYQMKLWDIRVPYAVLQNKTKDKGQGSEFISIAIHPNIPHIFATGTSNGVISLWDIRLPERPIHSIKAHLFDVWKISFHPSEPSVLISCSWEGSLILWDFSKALSNTTQINGGQVKQSELIRNPQSINSFDISPQLRTIVCGTDDDAIIAKKLSF